MTLRAITEVVPHHQDARRYKLSNPHRVTYKLSCGHYVTRNASAERFGVPKRLKCKDCDGE